MRLKMPKKKGGKKKAKAAGGKAKTNPLVAAGVPRFGCAAPQSRKLLHCCSGAPGARFAGAGAAAASRTRAAGRAGGARGCSLGTGGCLQRLPTAVLRAPLRKAPNPPHIKSLSFSWRAYR